MKSLKKLPFILLAVIAAFTIGFMAACTDDTPDDPADPADPTTPTEPEDEEPDPDEGETQYIFEAEYTYITNDMEGLGPSGSPFGLNLIQESSSASNGFYVGQLGVNSPITFTITSSETVTVTLRARFGSNSLGTVTWTPEMFIVTVNGETIDYTPFTTELATSDPENFKTYNLGEITLVEGENTIVFQAGNNTELNNNSSAPSIDYIMIVTSAALEMDEYPDNVL